MLHDAWTNAPQLTWQRLRCARPPGKQARTGQRSWQRLRRRMHHQERLHASANSACCMPNHAVAIRGALYTLPQLEPLWLIRRPR
jgi:hypothetical protein